MRADAGIHVEETATSLTLAWDNRALAKDRFLGCFLMLFWIIWAPATLLVTGLAWLALVRKNIGNLSFFLVWLVFGWAGTIGIPYSLLQRHWSESLTIDASAITLEYFGLLAKRPKVIPLERISEISIGHMPDSDGGESIVTLNILGTPAVSFWSHRQMIAYWLSPKLKEQLFQAIEAFSEMHGLKIRMTRYRK